MTLSDSDSVFLSYGEDFFRATTYIGREERDDYHPHLDEMISAFSTRDITKDQTTSSERSVLKIVTISTPSFITISNLQNKSYSPWTLNRALRCLFHKVINVTFDLLLLSIKQKARNSKLKINSKKNENIKRQLYTNYLKKEFLIDFILSLNEDNTQFIEELLDKLDQTKKEKMRKFFKMTIRNFYFSIFKGSKEHYCTEFSFKSNTKVILFNEKIDIIRKKDPKRAYLLELASSQFFNYYSE